MKLSPIVFIAAALGAVAAFMRAAKGASKPEDDGLPPLLPDLPPVDPTPTPPSPGPAPRFPPAPSSPERSILLSQYRRASFSELPPEIVAGAPLRLTLPLHSIEFVADASGGKWAYVVEVHENNIRGKHKGVSVFAKR